MKNVKVILTGVALCATVFATNARINALGGDAGFWPGDRANAELFPGALNDANWLEFGGVEGDPTASINWGDDVKWGFNFDTGADNNDWMNMSWAKDGMGLAVGFISASGGDAGVDKSGFDVAWGSTMSFGELGVGYSSYDDGMGGDAVTMLYANWRGDCSAWLFDNAKAGFWMDNDDMGLSYDLFTHVKPVDGVTALVGMGFEYLTTDAGDGSQMWLPNATFAVEAAMTDWATFRGFVEQNHWVSCEAADGSDCGSGNSTDYGFGVGFGWQAANGSSINLDATVGNNLFTEPIHTMTGFGALGTGEVTLSYTF
tara:strand:- start:2438 stop:3379 length:942 start_codon:yes stop_codon:yes gene_type:complete